MAASASAVSAAVAPPTTLLPRGVLYRSDALESIAVARFSSAPPLGAPAGAAPLLLPHFDAMAPPLRMTRQRPDPGVRAHEGRTEALTLQDRTGGVSFSAEREATESHFIALFAEGVDPRGGGTLYRAVPVSGVYNFSAASGAPELTPEAQADLFAFAQSMFNRPLPMAAVGRSRGEGGGARERDPDMERGEEVGGGDGYRDVLAREATLAGPGDAPAPGDDDGGEGDAGGIERFYEELAGVDAGEGGPAGIAEAGAGDDAGRVLDVLGGEGGGEG